MTSAVPATTRRPGRVAARRRPPGGPCDRRFEAFVFDWAGTAVADRQADVSGVRTALEALCARGAQAFVVTKTDVGDLDARLAARPDGPGDLFLLVNDGSEVFRVTRDGPVLVHRRRATPEEEASLDVAAERTVERLARHGLRAEVVSGRLNRRGIDLIPGSTWSDQTKAPSAELVDAVERRLRACGVGSLAAAVEIARLAAEEAGVVSPKVTSDARHVEIGLTDKADSARWAFTHLCSSGIAPAQVLVLGDEFGPLGGVPGSDSLLAVEAAREATVVSVGAGPLGVPAGVLHLGGGPERFLAILRDQVRRRDRAELPDVRPDPAWSLVVDGVDADRERADEARLTLGDGVVGTAAAPLLGHGSAAPRVLHNGIYEGTGPETTLRPLPDWTRLRGELPPGARVRRTLDLRAGLLRQEIADGPDVLRAVQLSSLDRPGTVALRALGPSRWLGGAPLTRPDGSGDERGSDCVRVEGGAGGAAVAAAQRKPARGALDRIAVYLGDAERTPTCAEARDALAAAERAGWESLVSRHRAAWARRWATADVSVPGHGDLTLAFRFALFHLIASAGSAGETAVGARGLTGAAYSGHVFWDTDVFVLPFLAATHPPAARAVLEYRLRRLDAARRAAASLGRAGARFPWESAAEGVDVTPRSARDYSGRLVRIRTGELEDHVVADVAWAADAYVAWSGDEAFARGPYRTLLRETARYWASRVRLGADGRAHVLGVIGPDEYHEPVDDNAYTNVMARWNLRRAAALPRTPPEERRRWRELADRLVDGFDASTELYEQFAGFYALEPLVVARVAPRRPIAADLLLGRERVAGAQVIKQADVLMLHHLVPDEVAADSLGANLAFYEPRTAHGSSLSPAVHASLFARAGRYDDALAALELAARLDLDDLTGTTGGGVHLATMGGLWQALAFGFAGLRPRGRSLTIDPRLPPAWPALRLRLLFRGRPLAIEIRHDEIAVEAGGGATVRRTADGWEVTT